MKRTAFSPHDEIYINYLKSSVKHNMPVQHYHDAYEIYLQLDGKRYLFFGNICYTLERGDLAIFKPFDLHYAESREADYYERYVLNFHEEDISAILNSSETSFLTGKLDSCVMHLDEDRTKELCEYFKHAESYTKESGFLANKLLRASVVELVWHTAKLINKDNIAKGKKVSANVSAAIKYINKHYREELTLDGICEAVNITKHHFCNIFKKVTGATIMEYVNNVRLIKVHSMLINTESRLEDIAKETGFSTALNLNRAFKKVYGMPPREFRKTRNKL